MKPASLLPRREGCLCPWASVTCLRFFPEAYPAPPRRGLPSAIGRDNMGNTCLPRFRHPRPVDNLPSPSRVWSSPTVLGVSLQWLGLFPPGGGRGPCSFSAEKVFTAGQRAQVRQVGALSWAHSRAVCAARTVKAPEPSEDSLCPGTWPHEV